MALVEICVEGVTGATMAEAAGADRIELCSALSEGGLTPSLGTAQAVLSRVERMGVRVMVRPRGGSFVVSPDELAVMLADIAALQAMPRPPALCFGFVFGAMTPAGDVDMAALSRLLAACRPLPVTFHKAFDTARDLPAALDTLVAAGVGRVLTSGGAPTAAAGADMLARLQAQAGGRVVVMAGGGVRAGNVAELLRATQVPEVHLRATTHEEVAAVLRATGRAQ